nr:hypothetical protein [Rhodococcus sp. (in: high G+C Gram-positive bacteria)]
MSVDTGLSIAALRSLAVLVPVLLAVVLWFAAPNRRTRGAAFLALLWNFIALLLIDALAVQQEWWTFGTTGNMWSQVPIDVVLGWAALWGAVPILLARWVNPVITVLVLVAGDVLAMSSLQPLVTLEPTWWWGECLAVGAALVPGVVLGYLTDHGLALRTRAVMQVVLFGSLLGFVVPTVAFEAAGSGWGQRADVGGPLDLILLQLMALVAIVALRAVAEFAVVGRGTPFPWDPPQRLVTTGPYAYVANPMQLSAVLLLLLGGAVLREPWLVAGALLGAAFSAGLAAWHEQSELLARHSESWTSYRRSVRDWIPRWTPTPAIAPAILYASVSCDPCSRVGPWFVRRSPVGLDVAVAEGHPQDLRRVRYEGASTADGTRAIGAALEHLSLGWAILGWLFRAPVFAWFLQLLVDATGGGPRSIRQTE